MNTRPHAPGPGNEGRSRLKWATAALTAFLCHVIAVGCAYVFVQLNRSDIRQRPLLRVDLLPAPRLQQSKDAQPRALPHKQQMPKQQPRKRPSSRPPLRRPESLPVDVDQNETALEPSPKEPKKSADLEKLDINIRPDILNNIALRDPRIRRKRQVPQIGPFARKRGPTKHNLPPDLKHEDIRKFIEVTWQPDFSQIKDEGIAKVSPAWIKRGLRQWTKNYQEQIKAWGRPDTKVKDFNDISGPVPFPDYSKSAVSVEIDIEPLRDGTWAASIAKPSGHPFFDAHTLAAVKEIARLFPPWEAGYGHALRYRMDANFIIIPPRISTLFGLSCSFPFCTPEEYKKLEVYHWFKKLIQNHVYFEGLIPPPPLEDAGVPEPGSVPSASVEP
ncbi:MAG: hypothetical protein QNJ97_21045 [Myxococcota bacterium]|nr:hypothetical protein [Myxococcota bacterium]